MHKNLNLVASLGAMSRKSKGSNAERELVHLFWSRGWACVRIAGSGSAHYPSPDVLAGNGVRRIAVECKSSGGMVKYLTSKEVVELQEFARVFGAEAWIGVRFDDMKWYFLSVDDLKKSGSSFSASVELVKRKGLLFEDLVGA